MAKEKKDMTPMERREQMIKDRAARLARDAKKQGITPAELAKKKKDTYVKVLGGAASLLPIGRIVSMASKVIKGGTTAKTAAKTSRALTTTTKPKTKSTTGRAVATRPSTAVKPRSTAVGPKKPSTPKREMKNITPTKRTKITTKPPKKSTKPVSKAKAAATVAATTALGAAALMGNKGQKKTQAATVATPTSRPKRPTTKKRSTGMSEGNTVAGSSGRRASKGPGVGKTDKKDPRKGFSSKATPGKKGPLASARKEYPVTGPGSQSKVLRPKKAEPKIPAGAKRFQGSYNSKTHKLQNIGGKTYVVKR
jgi:hypothetical protein